MKKSLLPAIMGLALAALTISNHFVAAAPGADSPKAGTVKTFTVKGVSFNMVYCPPGTFFMGNTPEQAADALKKGAWPWAVKCETGHKVTLTKGYWMLDTQVNQELWKAVIGSLPEKPPLEFVGEKLPVHRVNFADVTAFCQALSKELGVNFRLPTEAEFEHAARAGTQTVFPNGDTLDANQANMNGSQPYNSDVKVPGHKELVAGKSYKPNAWGIYDIPGQLHEWCLDHCKREMGPDGRTCITMVVTDTYVDGIVDPFCKVGDENKYRVCRNEGFMFGGIFHRVAFREVMAERMKYTNLGFRFVQADPIEDK